MLCRRYFRGKEITKTSVGVSAIANLNLEMNKRGEPRPVPLLKGKIMADIKVPRMERTPEV